jgi:hypothetical protein
MRARQLSIFATDIVPTLLAELRGREASDLPREVANRGKLKCYEEKRVGTDTTLTPTFEQQQLRRALVGVIRSTRYHVT